MPWVRLDDGFADHPKVERAGPLAAWLHVVAICYCSRHLTDGRIPKTKAPRLADIPQPAKRIRALIDAGMWEEDGDDYVIHDFLDYQPSKASVEADRKRDREKKRRQREAGMASRDDDGKFTGFPQGSPPGTPPGNPAGSPTVPDPSLPIDVKGGENSRAAAAAAPPLRCQAHADLTGDVPPCGACADARRAHDAWTRTNGTNGNVNTRLDGQQQATRAAAERHMAELAQRLEEPPDSDAAKKVSDLIEQHRLAARKPPA